jgi:putative membrane protein
MAKVRVDKADLKKLSEAVKRAESKTSGEIATAIVKESDNYALFELSFAIVVGIIYFSTLLFFLSPIEETIKGMFWDYKISYLVSFTGFSTFLVIILSYLFANIPIVDRVIIPEKIKKRNVRERAMRHFAESGVYETRERTGILIFISLLEQRVELIADKGINEKIEQKKWNDIVHNILDSIKNGNWVKGLSESIESCGELLAEHFPIQSDDKNEMNDDLEVLER